MTRYVPLGSKLTQGPLLRLKSNYHLWAFHLKWTLGQFSLSRVQGNYIHHPLLWLITLLMHFKFIESLCFSEIET